MIGKRVIKNMELGAVIISFLFLGISSVFQWDENPVMGIDKSCADSIIAVLCIVLMKMLGLWNTAGFQRRGFKKGMLYGIPFFIIGVGSIVLSNVGTDITNLHFISISNAILFTMNMLLVGMNEELWLRGLVLNGLIRKYGSSKKAVWKAILVSALIFGAIHIPNIFFMDPVTLVVQVMNAASAGVLFGVIYVKSQNIWAGILIHAIVDWCSLFIGNCFMGGSTVLSMEMNWGQACGVIALGSLPPIIISMVLLTCTKAGKICGIPLCKGEE